MGEPWAPWTPRDPARWNLLSSRYRARLARAGITEQSYTAGKSLKVARSHAATPEHPNRYNPALHPGYRGIGVPANVVVPLTRAQIADRMKEMLYVNVREIRGFDMLQLETRVARANRAALARMAVMDMAEWRELANGQGEPGYMYDANDGEGPINPFWYH